MTNLFQGLIVNVKEHIGLEKPQYTNTNYKITRMSSELLMLVLT